MTKFSFEVPIAHLKDFEPYQDFMFGLCFLTYTNDDYSAYLKKQCKVTKVIIDNSFNETNIPIATQEMERMYWEFMPSQVVSPDADWWPNSTVTNAFTQLSTKLTLDVVMGVYRSYGQFLELRHAGCTNFAIPYEWRYLVAHPEDCFEASHFLGLGNLDEVIANPPASLDTSIPIKMALRGERLIDWDGKYIRNHPHETSPVRLARVVNYFNTTLTDEQLVLAIQNIQDLKQAVNG